MLHRSADSLIVRALVALAERDFPTALQLRREIRRAGGGREAAGGRETPASPPAMRPPG